MNLPKHACGLYLTHNEHKDYYETLETWLDGRAETAPPFASDEARAKAMATDDVWVLQWYPRTPVGFNLIAAPTLEELLAFAAEVEAHETP